MEKTWIYKAPRENWPPYVIEQGYSGSVEVINGIAKTDDPIMAKLLHLLGYNLIKVEVKRKRGRPKKNVTALS